MKETRREVVIASKQGFVLISVRKVEAQGRRMNPLHCSALVENRQAVRGNVRTHLYSAQRRDGTSKGSSYIGRFHAVQFRIIARE